MKYNGEYFDARHMPKGWWQVRAALVDALLTCETFMDIAGTAEALSHAYRSAASIAAEVAMMERKDREGSATSAAPENWTPLPFGLPPEGQ